MRARNLASTSLVMLGLAGSGLALSGTVALAAVTHPYLSQMTGTPGGSFGANVCGVTVDPASQDVYVADTGVIDVFDSAGVYQSQITGAGTPPGSFSSQYACSVAVNDTNGEVYVADSQYDHVFVFSATGAYLFTIDGAGTPAGSLGGGYVHVGVDQQGGDVYVADSTHGVVDRFSAAGAYQSRLTGFSEPWTLASDATGELYVLDRGAQLIDVFDSSGSAIGQISGASAPGGSFGELSGVAVDSAGNVYASDRARGVIDEFDSAGNFIGETTGEATPGGAFGTLAGLAVGASGKVYAADTRHVVDVFASGGVVPDVSAGTPTGVARTTVTLNGSINPAGTSTTVCAFEYGTSVSYGQQAPCAPAAPYSGSSPIAVAANLTGLTPGVTYHYRLTAGNASGNSRGPDQTFTTTPAVEGVQTAAASEVLATSATLNGALEPNGFDTHFFFEYGQDESYGTSTPSEDAGQATELKPVQAPAGGLQPHTSYHFRLVAENSLGITRGPDEMLTTAAVPPAITGAPSASNATRTSVVLHGTVNPENSEITGHFVYVESADYDPTATNPYAAGGVTAPVSAGSGLGDTVVTQLLASGLLPGETYHFALVAVNAAGIVVGPDATFTTAVPTPPEVETTGVENLSQNAASITGTIQALGLQATYHFDVATDTNYGPPTGFVAVAASAQGSQAVASNLVNLQPATTYYYRVVATNQDGTTYGETRSFTTPGYPALAGALAAPPLIATPAIAFPLESGGSTVAPKTLTRAQKLAKALKACAKKPSKQRAGCRKQARKSYGPVSRKKAKKT